MLDESLPTFRLKSNRLDKHNETLLFSHYGSEFEPKYSLRHLDPQQHGSKNRYAAALYDSYNSDVLYAEALLIPEWTQPSLSAEQIRLNGGVPPAPQPILPSEFALQLYNPDQQVIVRHKPSKWNQSESWDFELPSRTFRAPSASALDRSQNDPSVSENTPRVGLRWKKDSKLNKDLVCFQSGKALNPDGTKKKHKEPDITIAIFQGQKEVTLYEPNLIRVDIEDIKGLEVVLLLGAVVIRDVYFGEMKNTFNLTEGRKASGSNSTSPRPVLSQVATSPVSPPGVPARDPRIPPTDPRSQWELDAETARLKQQIEAEERQRKKRDEAEERRVKQMLEAEENEARRKQAQIDEETERLKRIYGDQQRPQSHPARRYSSDPRQSQPQPQPIQHHYPAAWGSYNAGPYMSGANAQSSFLTPVPQQNQRLKNKSSIFSFGRRRSEEDGAKLSKKRSAVF
ncbi:uncharacterized protein HMPREF1541_04470 [Cyphellophora europaea CBS 101466]|uniref:Uncharacterized protein n=1 Tax=Cyphellophora europaea (strain CBS 101466) TaxID=1220924 RepID=W2RWW9_CYPE1|nr:uncharacterized protein HMPREF1541_04470 [Cyphellophora europaea CBS 101466]ETN40194.1 hypothetical protein HMPREF1541_04470 [Cyphellophora europaea CBS 101466]